MTKKNRLLLFGLALCLCLPATTAHAEDEEPLGADVVARVAGRELTLKGLCLAAAQQKMPQLKRAGSNATTTLRGLIEQKVVEQEAKRLGITVSQADIDRRYKAFEADVRRKFRGQKTLADLMKQENTNPAEFRALLRMQILKHRVAAHDAHLGENLPKDESAQLIQIEIVVNELMKGTLFTYDDDVPGIAPGQNVNVKVAPLGKGVILTVQAKGVPKPDAITRHDFGHALIMRLPSSDVRDILDIEVKTGLLASAGYRMSDADFDREVARQREHWGLQRTLASQAALGTISYDDWIEAKYRMTIPEMKRKRYWRGYLALVEKMRAQITAEQVREEYEKKRETHWGEFILVTEFSIEFAPDGSQFTNPDLRSLRDARRLAQDIPRQLAAGIPFDQIVRTINGKRDSSFRAQRRRLRPNTDDLKLWERAKHMKDGDLSSPFSTLTFVHLLKREALHPAPTFDEIKLVVREGLARNAAREWIEERAKDPTMVQVRWPLTQRGRRDEDSK